LFDFFFNVFNKEILNKYNLTIFNFDMKADITIIGGAGHIGLPLGLLLANKGKKVVLYDKDKAAIKKINNQEMPFMENGGLEMLRKNKKKIFATTNKEYITN